MGLPTPGGPAVDVIVADAAQRAALVAVRELGRAGIRTCAVDGDAFAPGLASRWAVRRARVPEVAHNGDAFVDGVLGVCQAVGPRVLVLCHDGSIEAVTRRRAEVERSVRVALASGDALSLAVDKRQTLALAQDLGIRTPRGVVVRQEHEVLSALREVGLPVVIKPTQSWVWNGDSGVRLAPSVSAHRIDAIARVARLLEHGVPALVQEWLPGQREAVNLFYAGGRIWARFAQRALRTSPPVGGNSVLRESIALPGDIGAQAESLVRRMDLEGYSEVEFRRDAQGRPALMEVNPRLSASVEVAVRAGVGFPRLLYDWAAGRPLSEQSNYRLGVRMRWLGGDVSWMKQSLQAGPGPDVPSRSRVVGGFVSEFLRPARYDYLDRDDLRPAVRAVLGTPRRYARRPRTRRSHGLDADTAVIGAGPYGLAISAHLRGSGIAHEVFGQTMDSWANHMPQGMCLKSEGFASNISAPTRGFTLAQFCAETGTGYGRIASPISLDTFVAYGRWFQERVVPDVRPELVELVRRAADRFEVVLAGGDTLRAARVILATGNGAFTYTPPELQSLPDRLMSHSYDEKRFEGAGSGELLVVGAGQSALESAALAHEHGQRVTILARAPRLAWNSKPGGRARPIWKRMSAPESGLGEGRGQFAYANYPLAFHRGPAQWRREKAWKVLGPAGAWWLRPRVENEIPVLLGRTVVGAGADGDRVRLSLRGPEGMEEVSGDKVLVGTGYRPDLARFALLDRALRNEISTFGGAPVLGRDFQSSVPGLYFVGYLAAVSFGPVMRFVFGTEFTARRLVTRLPAASVARA